MIHAAQTVPAHQNITDAEISTLLDQTLAQAPAPLNKVLLIPPDHTRLNSYAGTITQMLYQKLRARNCKTIVILPALGTHCAMTETELRLMFGSEIPRETFHVHHWKQDTVPVGTIPGEQLALWTQGRFSESIEVAVNRMVFDSFDWIVSIGQVVPHEVVGLANYTKNIMVGIGGGDLIQKSHWVGALCNMEKIMGRIDTPVRKIFNYGMEHFLQQLPLTYILTVRSRDPYSDAMNTDGIFCGNGSDLFEQAGNLARERNLTLLEKPLKKVVVYLDPQEFKSTWLGNKAIYRTRMAIADEGELMILAPALRCFGEDPEIDQLIRRYGYHGTEATLKAFQEHEDLRSNPGAAAHLIHGSSEGRFQITYCPGQDMSQGEIEAAGFHYAPYELMRQRYPLEKLHDGLQTLESGEEIFFISNPALGLWALKEAFGE